MPIKPKRSMSSFDVAAAAAEMARLLPGARLSNIYDAPGGFLLRFKGRGEARLIAVPGERAHLTRYDIGEKGFPSPLVMGLRKYIREAVVEGVEQHSFDRILVLRLSRRGEDYSLVVEVLPRGVLALLDAGGVILQVSEKREMRDRVLRRGMRYEPPPSRIARPDELTPELVREALSRGPDAVRSLVRGLGYPGEVVEEVLARLGIPVDAEPRSLMGREAEIAEALKTLYRESLGGRGFLVYSISGEPLTVVPFEPRGLGQRYGLRYSSIDSFNEALDRFFGEELARIREAEAVKELESEKSRLLASLENARRNLEALREKLQRLEQDMAVLGENIGLLYEAYSCIERVHKTAGWDAVPGTCPGVVDVEPQRGIVRLSLGGRIVEVDARLPPDKLLVEMSRRAGELRAKIERGLRAVKDIEARLEELERRRAERAARARAVIRRREWYERYHWLVTRNGFLAIGGRDASQNESVVKRYLTEKRIFLHADVHGAPAVVLFNEGVEPPAEDLRDAALLTAAYSKAWKAGVGAVDVYWAWGSQVSKAAPAGEYLAKGAFMVYGRRNYIRGVELRLALGVGLEDGSPLVIVGPQDVVKRRSLVYAVLVPGDEDPSRLASRLRRLFSAKAPEEHRGAVAGLPVEEIRQRIPGRSRVIHISRGEAVEPPRPVKLLPGSPQAETSPSTG